MTHKHIWIKDTSRKHGRPPRIFVKCETCPATGQAVISYGFTNVFRINESKYVGAYFDITPEQKAKLKKSGNQSETVRIALDRYFERVYTSPYKT